jgi:inosose dehydratase
MKIAFGTYGMPHTPIWEALPRLAKMGYEAVEICAAERWSTAPNKLSTADRTQIRTLIRELGLELPAIMQTVNLLAAEGEEATRQEAIFLATCELARDLATGGEAQSIPVIANVVGHCPLEWPEALSFIIQRCRRFGELAAKEGCRLALEPHVGPLVNSPPRTLEVLEKVHSPSLGINFDISHFEAIGYPRERSITELVPYALHTHVKDVRIADGKVQFLLPGESGFDYGAYFREMAAAGWNGSVCVEVSAQIFNRPGYDPWDAAAYSLQVLTEARAAALQ